jgi:hypothetical protein
MVIAEALSVVVRRSTLEDKYPGGFEGYRDACPNLTFCADDHLTRVGFQTPGDVAGWRAHLERLGFLILDGDRFADFAIVDQRTGPTAPCDWLAWSPGEGAYSVMWLAGTPAGDLAHPIGWTPELSATLSFVRGDDFTSRMLPLARHEGLEVYLDTDKGREVFLGRPFPKMPAFPSGAAPTAELSIAWVPVEPLSRLGLELGESGAQLPHAISARYVTPSGSVVAAPLDAKSLSLGILLAGEAAPSTGHAPTAAQSRSALRFAAREMGKPGEDEMCADAAAWLREHQPAHVALRAMRRAVVLVPDSVVCRGDYIVTLCSAACKRPDAAEALLRVAASEFREWRTGSTERCHDEETVFYAGLAALAYLGESEVREFIGTIRADLVARSSWLRDGLARLQQATAGRMEDVALAFE